MSLTRIGVPCVGCVALCRTRVAQGVDHRCHGHMHTTLNIDTQKRPNMDFWKMKKVVKHMWSYSTRKTQHLVIYVISAPSG